MNTQTDFTAHDDDRFAFGRNWEDFLAKNYSEERAQATQEALLSSLHKSSLSDLTFLDIGSGSGIHSLSAWRAGASQVVSFDYDVNSVAATRSLWHMAGEPENWTVQQGSVLDAEFMQTLGTFDIVYSWGVLHHTGDMWQAIRNAAIPLKKNGIFFIALYSYTSYENGSLNHGITPEDWLAIKKNYNMASSIKKRYMEWYYTWKQNLSPYIAHPRQFIRACINLYRYIAQYSKQRGMSFWIDVRDWLGGWPMEFIKEGDCLRFCRDELDLEPLAVNTGEGNTEFIFRPVGSANYWDTVLEQRKTYALKPPFTHVSGKMWKKALPEWQELADNDEYFKRSPLILQENEQLYGYGHSLHTGIAAFGNGRYSHWEDCVYFCTSDGSDPNTNNRVYSFTL